MQVKDLAVDRRPYSPIKICLRFDGQTQQAWPCTLKVLWVILGWLTKRLMPNAWMTAQEASCSSLKAGGLDHDVEGLYLVGCHQPRREVNVLADEFLDLLPARVDGVRPQTAPSLTICRAGLEGAQRYSNNLLRCCFPEEQGAVQWRARRTGHQQLATHRLCVTSW